MHHQTDNIPNAPFTEIGWRLSSQHWQHGYATEAAQCSLEFAFKTLNSDAVYAFTTLDNIPSQKVMLKLGMTNTHQDFNHPNLEKTHPMSRHCLYKIKNQYRES